MSYKHELYKFSGSTSTDTAMIEEETIRQIVFPRAEEMLVGKSAVEMQGLTQLNWLMSCPKKQVSTPQDIQELAGADFDNIEFFEKSGRLTKWQRRFFISYEAIAEQQDDIQVKLQLEAMARGLAQNKDSAIFTTLYAGAGETQAATAAWTADTAKVGKDIANAIGKIMTNTYITDADIGNMALFYPAGLFGNLALPQDVGTLQSTLRAWVKDEFGINMFPTRQLTSNAMLVTPGPLTAVLMEYTGSQVPRAEVVERPGKGREYIVTSYHDVFVFPNSETDATNDHICSLTGVVA